MSSTSTAGPSSTSATRALALEFKNLQTEPVEGFTVTINEDNLYDWRVAIFGPPGTLFEGGYFKARLRFPSNYPYSPPTMRFLTRVLHPNVYENGDLCISILHPPVDDPRSGELVSERWNPTQNSPANVDASVMYRKWRDGQDDTYKRLIREQVASTLEEAVRDGVQVPTTDEEYCLQAKLHAKKAALAAASPNDDDFDMDFDDHYYDYGDDSDDDEEENNLVAEGIAEDSGQGEAED